MARIMPSNKWISAVALLTLIATMTVVWALVSSLQAAKQPRLVASSAPVFVEDGFVGHLTVHYFGRTPAFVTMAFFDALTGELISESPGMTVLPGTGAIFDGDFDRGSIIGVLRFESGDVSAWVASLQVLDDLGRPWAYDRVGNR